MRLGWVIAGTVAAVPGLSFSFMMWAFTVTGLDKRRSLDGIPMGPALRRYLGLSVVLLVGSWPVAAGLVWWAYFRHPSTVQHAWWSLPLVALLLHVIICARAMDARPLGQKLYKP